MDKLERAVISERAFIRTCTSVPELVDRMAEYRAHARRASRVGDVRVELRVSDLLELAEDRVAALKAEAAQRHRAAPPAPSAWVAAELAATHHEPPAPRPTPSTRPRPTDPGGGVSDARVRRAEAEARAAKAEVAREREARAAAVEAAYREAEARAKRAREARAAVVQAASREAEERARETTRQELERVRVAAEERVRSVEAELRRVLAQMASVAAEPPNALTVPPKATGEALGEAPAAVPMPRASTAERPGRVHTGADVARLRAERGLTLRAFAKLLGVSAGTICKAEGAPEKPVGEALAAGVARLV